MLLARSKESKNSSKIKASQPFGWGVFTLFSPLAFAQEAPSTSEISQIASIFGALLVVVGLIFFLAFMAKRFNLGAIHSKHIRVVASMSAGHKERIMVIEVGGEQHLVGVTQHNIAKLHTLAQPLTLDESKKSSFQDNLVQAMAQKINPNSKANGDRHE